MQLWRLGVSATIMEAQLKVVQRQPLLSFQYALPTKISIIQWSFIGSMSGLDSQISSQADSIKICNPKVIIAHAKTVIPTSCMRLFPIGYRYWFRFFMTWAVNYEARSRTRTQIRHDTDTNMWIQLNWKLQDTGHGKIYIYIYIKIC